MENVKTLKIGKKEYYVFEADHFENEAAAEKNGYYWNDDISKWTKEIINSTTTIF